ncbi:hypothetical protein Scep_005696 [Stephania cephalantha]|uniref:protein-serine/threonine phosphatase n=1 Tax=Stephania cephalantha TaxID=152367 RepID=A0AAP0KWH9_9MAGN
MSCAVAVSNSPVFSPSRVPSIFCKATVSSPENLTLTHHNHHQHHHGSSSPCASSGSGTASPFRVRIQKSPSGLRSFKKEGGGGAVEAASGSVLKRKRPARIDIPVAALSFAAAAATPVAVEADVEVEREGFSVYCKRGRREAMEDRYSAVVGIQGDPKQAFFGVFDGHGGAKAAEFASKNIDKNIINELTRREGEGIVEAVRHGYLTTDSEFLKEDVHGGTCCVTALIRNGNLVVSNAGDCRAVVSRGGTAEALTSDHRPSREDERERIEAQGGYVDCRNGIWRIQGTLAVSRGVGDGHLKQWVIAEPETKVLAIEPDHEFLILASDGLWDKVSNQEAVDVARALCVETKPETLSACKKLTKLAISRGSCDDISVMVIHLGRFI